jgi:hypothetical protein
MFFIFWRKKLEQKPNLVRDRDGKLKICHRPGLGAQKVEKHCSRQLDIVICLAIAIDSNGFDPSFVVSAQFVLFLLRVGIHKTS